MLDDNKVDPLRAKFLIGKINIYSHFMSFLHTDFAQPVGIYSLMKQGLTYSTKVNIMGDDALATQGNGASATILTMLNRINSVPAR